jgi:hypothetical protein
LKCHSAGFTLFYKTRIEYTPMNTDTLMSEARRLMSAGNLGAAAALAILPLSAAVAKASIVFNDSLIYADFRPPPRTGDFSACRNQLNRPDRIGMCFSGFSFL